MKFENTRVWISECDTRDDDTDLSKRNMSGLNRKFMRQIFVTVDITASLYWWEEFEAYGVGTVSNSVRTVHNMVSKPITLDCFEIDDYDRSIQLIDPINICIRVSSFVDDLEQLRQLHLQYAEASKNEGITEIERKRLQKAAKKYYKELIRWLPESWLQTRTVTMNYENLFMVCSQDWSEINKSSSSSLVSWVRTLPYARELILTNETLNEK